MADRNRVRYPERSTIAYLEGDNMVLGVYGGRRRWQIMVLTAVGTVIVLLRKLGPRREPGQRPHVDAVAGRTAAVSRGGSGLSGEQCAGRRCRGWCAWLLAGWQRSWRWTGSPRRTPSGSMKKSVCAAEAVLVR